MSLKALEEFSMLKTPVRNPDPYPFLWGNWALFSSGALFQTNKGIHRVDSVTAFEFLSSQGVKLESYL